jgi:hypothetical protein
MILELRSESGAFANRERVVQPRYGDPSRESEFADERASALSVADSFLYLNFLRVEFQPSSSRSRDRCSSNCI